MKLTYRYLFILFSSLCFQAYSQTTTLISPTGNGGFETGSSFALNGWTVVNGTQPAKWYCGTSSTGYTGARAANIGTGSANNKYNHTSSSDVHFYQDIVFPSGQPYVTLSFSWQGVGESCCDYMEVFLVPTTTTPVAGTQLSSGQIGINYNQQSTWQNVTIQLPCTVAGTTQRLVFSWHNDASIGTDPAAAVDNISLTSTATVPTCASLLGTGVTNVVSLPYASGAGTTCGAVNDQTSSNTVTCGSSAYLGGEDQVWVFTPTSTGQITINLTSSGSWTGLMLYQGCPMSAVCSGTGTCVANSQSSAGNQSICANVTAGQTYYLILDSDPSPTCNPYSNLTISAPSGIPAGNVCSTAPFITLPYTATGQTTACYGDDYNNASLGSCGSSYESGEDRVYAYTSAGNECIGITLSNASSSSIGFGVYSGCPGSAGTTCIGSFGGSNPLTGSVTLSSAGTYYIICDSWNAPFNYTYDISVTSFGSGPVNDLPCNATVLALGVSSSGDNTCSSGSGEPAGPACWTNGNINTVWYSIVCPSSGKLDIRTTLGTIVNTQIAVFSGTCGPGLTMVGCNDDIAACGSSYYYNSDLALTGLTAGATYYIAVDGYSNNVGTFSILAVDGNVGYPPIAGQDCMVANPVCAQSISVGNPGYQAIGNVCDFPGGGTNCLASGERGSAWYTIPINAAGVLQFDIVPNDYTGGNGCCSTDYDFAVWKVGGTGATTCSGIAAGATPVACNYSGLGVTGCYSSTAGVSPAAYPGYGAAYQAQITVAAGDVYELVVSNFSNSTSGFTLNFNATAPINYTAAPTSVVWSGGTSTSWAVPSNWGGCSIPACTIDAQVTASSTNQPVLTAGTYNVKNLTINAGATLTMQSGAILNICGDYTNNGSLIANSGATIVFNNGAVVQNINGSLVGANQFPNLTITKTGGSVSLNQNIDIGGSFTTSNSTSVFNTNGDYIRVAGNFNNSSGGTTFTNVGTGTLEFNGSAAQTYTAGGTLTLNNVTMNQSAASSLTLNGNNLIIGTTGVLTLTQGKIITGTLEVTQNNTAPTSVTAGLTTSYVEGNLRRYLSSTGSFDFPVGEATKGYQRANINFTSATTIPNLVARFDPWSPNPGPQGGTECSAVTYNLNDLDNGYWTITASANATSGTYNTTLYSTNYTNNGSAFGWTVTKNSTGPWILDGTCVTSSTASNTQRTGMNGFSKFAVAQTTGVLPIELLDFSGQTSAGSNQLKWITASETNNNYFSIQRSSDAHSFFEIGRVTGAGTTSQVHYYTYEDKNPPEGVSYYKLKQVDFDGGSSYSRIIALTNVLNTVLLENIFPNPTTRDVNFDFVTPLKGTVTIVITDIVGRAVSTETRSATEGRNLLTAHMNELPQGTYYMKVSFDTIPFMKVNKIIKN